MPRYIARRATEPGKFAMILLKMTNFSKFDLVQIFLNTDCKLLTSEESENLEIQMSRTILLNEN